MFQFDDVIMPLQQFQQFCHSNVPDSKVRGANMGPTWGRQDPGEPHVGPMHCYLGYVPNEEMANQSGHHCDHVTSGEEVGSCPPSVAADVGEFPSSSSRRETVQVPPPAPL